MVEKRYTTPTGLGTYYQYRAYDGYKYPIFDPIQGWESSVYFRSQPNPAWMATRSDVYKRRPDLMERLTSLDLGNGAFLKESVVISELSHAYHQTSPFGALGVSYAGPFLPTTSPSLRAYALALVPWPSMANVSLDLIGLGSTAISRTLPTRTNASLAVTLAELRKEGLPRLIGLQSLTGREGPVKNLAGEYLNYEFGWKPLIKDVEKLLVSVRDSRKILEQYNRGSGRTIRRRYHFPDKKETFVWRREVTPPYPAASNEYNGAGNGTLTLSGTFTTKAWFSGAYRYLIPVDDSLLGKLKEWEREANLLLGTRITPEVIWNATSWTWLIDWMVNVGDIVTNLSYLGQEGLVLQYGYIMRHAQLEADVHSTSVPRGSNRQLSCKLVIDQKARIAATPYGFGLNPESFTSKQWSILAALGITKVPGRF